MVACGASSGWPPGAAAFFGAEPTLHGSAARGGTSTHWSAPGSGVTEARGVVKLDDPTGVPGTSAASTCFSGAVGGAPARPTARILGAQALKASRSAAEEGSAAEGASGSPSGPKIIVSTLKSPIEKTSATAARAECGGGEGVRHWQEGCVGRGANWACREGRGGC